MGGKSTAEHSRTYRELHPERKRANARRWAARNRPHVRENFLRWLALHPEKIAEYNATRRARLSGAFVEHVDRSVVWSRDDGTCGICCHPADPLDWHLDHIIPISRGGEHSYANTWVTHPLCNWGKAAKVA